MIEHTPGPWIDGGPIGKGRWITNDAAQQIAVVYGAIVRPEAEANARLIAAAPDMLAALQLYDATYASTQTHPTASQEAAVINAVRSVLAKVTIPK
jgi:hypothetical protein